MKPTATPLQAASVRDYKQVAEMLLDAGAYSLEEDDTVAELE